MQTGDIVRLYTGTELAIVVTVFESDKEVLIDRKLNGYDKWDTNDFVVVGHIKDEE